MNTKPTADGWIVHPQLTAYSNDLECWQAFIEIPGHLNLVVAQGRTKQEAEAIAARIVKAVKYHPKLEAAINVHIAIANELRKEIQKLTQERDELREELKRLKLNINMED